MAEKKKASGGVWIELNSGVKRILDIICTGKGYTRKAFCTNLVEDTIVSLIPNAEVFKSALRNIDPALTEAFIGLEKRVLDRRSVAIDKTADQIKKESAAIDQYEQGLAEPVDLPHEVVSE